MDIKTFEDLWKPYGTDKDSVRRMWNRWAEKYKEQRTEDDFNNPNGQLIDYLAKKGILNGTDILDIGCAVGKHAQDMAKTAKSVTGIDIAPKMIELAKEYAIETGANNVEFHVMDWENTDIAELGWEKKFDLTFASKTPALNSRQGLEKMIAASKQACLFSTFAQRSNNIRLRLKEAIEGLGNNQCGVKDKTEEPFFITFSILWLLGYFPEVTFIETGWENFYDVEESIDLSIKFYDTYGVLTDDKKSAIDKELRKIAVDGKIHEVTNAVVAWIYWKV